MITRVAIALLGAAVLAISLGIGGAVAGDAIECRCRYAGENYAEGQCVCIRTPSGGRYACCGKVLNNTSWSFRRGGCPMAEAVVDPAKPPSSTGIIDPPSTNPPS